MSHAAVKTPGTVIRTNTGVPANSLGANTDLYVDDATGKMWKRVSGAYVLLPTLPKVTTSTWAGGPPASPSEGDIWFATTVGGSNPGVRWQFQYNSTNAWWNFVGGPPWQAHTAGGSLANLSGWSQVPGSNTFTCRQGGYEVWGAFTASGGNTYQTTFIGIGVNGGPINVGAYFLALAGQNFSISSVPIGLGMGPGDVFSLMYWDNGGGGFGYHSMTIIPQWVI